VTILLVKLRAGALQLAKKLISGQDNVDWTTLRTNLRDTFKAGDEQLNLRLRLRMLNMSACGNDFQKYLFKFQNIMTQVDDFPEKELIFNFLNGLPARIKFDVLSQNPSSILDAITIARRSAECDKNSSEETTKQSNYARPIGMRRSQYKPFNREHNNGYNGNNNFRRRFAHNDKFRSNGGSGNRYRTNSENGTRVNKVNSYGNKSPNNRTFNKNRYLDLKNKKCFKCNRYGHLANKCYVKKINVVEIDDIDYAEDANFVKCNMIEVMTTSSHLSLLWHGRWP
jgi:hypothetical protein